MPHREPPGSLVHLCGSEIARAVTGLTQRSVKLR